MLWAAFALVLVCLSSLWDSSVAAVHSKRARACCVLLAPSLPLFSLSKLSWLLSAAWRRERLTRSSQTNGTQSTRSAQGTTAPTPTGTRRQWRCNRRFTAAESATTRSGRPRATSTRRRPSPCRAASPTRQFPRAARRTIPPTSTTSGVCRASRTGSRTTSTSSSACSWVWASSRSLPSSSHAISPKRSTRASTTVSRSPFPHISSFLLQLCFFY
mmetsp:Transcript_75307/g.232925  ORF Transcript_75307/g.232925 Transcript_75307/m.232925 type:complete len:215 (-) Transcript_75307:6-650(-)